MNKDRPVQQRTKFSFLLNLKKLLQGWSLENVRFDEDADFLSIAGDDIVKVEVVGFELKLNWLDDKWKQWAELTEDPKFEELIKTHEGSAFHDEGKGESQFGLMVPAAHGREHTSFTWQMRGRCQTQFCLFPHCTSMGTSVYTYA